MSRLLQHIPWYPRPIICSNHEYARPEKSAQKIDEPVIDVV